MSERKKSTEEQMEKIDVIRGSEVLGYEGGGRGEHSGENAPTTPKNLNDELADNKKEDM